MRPECPHAHRTGLSSSLGRWHYEVPSSSGPCDYSCEQRHVVATTSLDMHLDVKV